MAVAAAAVRGNARLGVVGQGLRSCSPEGALAEPSPWKQVHFRRAVTSVSLCRRHFLLPSFLSPFFLEASLAGSRGTLVPNLFWWIFVFFGLVWFARFPKSPSGPGSGTPCRGSRPHVEVSGLRFAWPTWVPRLRGLLVLRKPAVLLQCWFAGKPIFILWLRDSRGSPGHY